MSDQERDKPDAAADAYRLRDYHLRELEIARDPEDPNHSLPPISSADRRILDVGCGAGQTLIASELGRDVMACGIDRDLGALALGQKLTEGVCFVGGAGEALPFRNGYFDLVICRGAIMHMNVPGALTEFARVLRDGGRLWLVMWTLSEGARKSTMTIRPLRRRFQLKKAGFRLYVLVNTLWFHLWGRVFRFPVSPRRYESCQTRGGIRRALRRAGFVETDLTRQVPFIAVAEK